MTSFAKRAAHGTILVIMLGMVSNLLAYALRLMLARWLPQEDFGLFYAVVAVVGLLYIFTHLGLNDALTRHIAASRVRNNISSIKEGIVLVVLIQIVFSILVVGVIALLAPWLQEYYFRHPRAATVFVVHSLGMILLPFETLYLSIFQGFQRMSLFGAVNVSRMASVLILTMGYLYAGFGVLSPALGYLSWYVIAIAVYSPIVARKVIPGFFSIPYTLTKGLAKSLLGFGLPVIFSSVAGVVVSYTDTIMLTALRGSLQEVAIYNVAMPTASILWFFSAGLAIVVFPITSELWERRYHAHLQEGIELVYRYALMLILPAALALATFPDVVLSTLFGPGFESGAPVLRVLSIGAVLFTFGRVNEAFFSGMGVPRINSKVVWTGAVVNVIANALLIPRFGMMGAAVGTVMSFAAILVMGLVNLRRQVLFSIPWAGWAKVAIAGLGFVLVLAQLKVVLPLPVWPKIVVGFLGASLVYGAILLVLRAVTIGEIKRHVSRVW